MIRLCGAFIFAMCLTAIRPQADAQTIVVMPGQNANQVEQLGYPTTYQLQLTSKWPYSVAWSWRQNDGDCVSGYRNGVNQNGDSNFNYSIPGEFDIRAVITYMSSSDPTAGPFPQNAPPVLKHVVIPVPTCVIYGYGANGTIPSSSYTNMDPGANGTPATTTSLGGQNGIWIFFVLKCKGNTVGPQHLLGTAQEKITNKMILTTTPPSSGGADDPAFVPTTPDNRYFLSSIMTKNSTEICIADFKSNTSTAPRPNGVYASYTQENQLTYSTLCNAAISKSLGKLNFNISGTNNPDTWTTATTP